MGQRLFKPQDEHELEDPERRLWPPPDVVRALPWERLTLQGAVDLSRPAPKTAGPKRRSCVTPQPPGPAPNFLLPLPVNCIYGCETSEMRLSSRAQKIWFASACGRLLRNGAHGLRKKASRSA